APGPPPGPRAPPPRPPALLIGAAAPAHPRPARTYSGTTRPIPMTVTIPQSAAPGEVPIQLLEPVTAKPLARAPVLPGGGGVDMAALFPVLWTGAPALVYAQLFVGEDMIGPAVVLQPMGTPASPARVGAYGDPGFNA